MVTQALGSLASPQALSQHRASPATMGACPSQPTRPSCGDPGLRQPSPGRGGACQPRADGGGPACVHEPSGHTTSQASGRGGGKGGSRGATQPLSPSPPATLVRLGWPSLAQDTAQLPWPCSPRAHPTARPLPRLWVRTKRPPGQPAPSAAPFCLWHWAGGLALPSAHCSPRSPLHGEDSRCLSRWPLCWGPPGALRGRQQPGVAGIWHPVEQGAQPLAGRSLGCRPVSGPCLQLVSGSLLWVTVPSVCPSQPHYTEGPPPPQDRGNP